MAHPRPQPAPTRALAAWALYDFANSAFSTVVSTFVFAAYFARSVAANEEAGQSQWGLTIGLAGLAVALLGPILGATADQGGRRKPWILVFTLLCIAATAALWLVQPRQADVVLALILVAFATVASEAAVIFYNAMLPDLAPENRVGRWSGWGWAVGYTGGVLSLIVALLVFVQPEEPPLGLARDQAQHIRATFPLTAAWFLVFCLPFFFLTPDTRGTGKRLPAAVRDGFRQVGRSLTHVRHYSPIVRFLIAKMLYIDGLVTVFAFGGIYAAGAFEMTQMQVIYFGIALNVTAALGAFALAPLDDRFGSRNTILLSLVGLIVTVTLILLVGAAPWTALLGPSEANHDLGLMTLGRDSLWFWIFGLILGLFVGPVQAASRSWLARAAPPDLRNEFFGLYALSGKATAFLGPLLVGWITAWTQSQRWGLSTVLLFFVAGLILLLTVPPATRTPGP